MNKKLKFHTDPGHGWLEVDIADIQDLEISAYSYMDTAKGKAYLEEDSDAGKYIDKMFGNVEKNGQWWNDNFSFPHTDRSHWIRRLSGYAK